MANNTEHYTLNPIQWWKGKDSNDNKLSLHWALTIQMSGINVPVGSIYNATGNIDTFYYEALHNVSLIDAYWRGALPAAEIPKDRLSQMEQLLAKVPVVRNDFEWDCQNWVWNMLRALRQENFEVGPETWDKLGEMDELLESWERAEI